MCSVWLFREKQISIHILLNLQLSYNRSLTLTNATYMYDNFCMLNFHHAVVGVQQLMLHWFISRVLWKHLSGELFTGRARQERKGTTNEKNV